MEIDRSESFCAASNFAHSVSTYASEHKIDFAVPREPSLMTAGICVLRGEEQDLSS